MALTVVVLEGDETGQELLQAVRVLDPELLGLDAWSSLSSVA